MQESWEWTDCEMHQAYIVSFICSFKGVSVASVPSTFLHSRDGTANKTKMVLAPLEVIF